tara:strand:- start:1309 stop:1524 length:216 start_codon:yes stop_codon:yes gene_type:complete
MSRITYDFQIISNTLLDGVSLVMAQNEDAFSYLTDELNYQTLEDGSAPVFTEVVGDFISDAEQAHMCCNYI